MLWQNAQVLRVLTDAGPGSLNTKLAGGIAGYDEKL